MAGTVGGIYCDIVSEQELLDLTTRLETWTVPGMDGVGAQDLGKSESRFRYRLIGYGTTEGIEGWIVSIEALKGTVVTIVNDWGETRTEMLIVSMTIGQKRPAWPMYQCRGEIVIEGVVAV